MASEEDSAVWKAYRAGNMNQAPKNASQLMRWTKANEHVRNLSFSQAKKIFSIKSKEPEPDDDAKQNGPPKPKVDMTAEKEELKEYISECKEELVSLQNRELQMEDDYEEGNEGLETQFEELEALLKKAKEEIQGHRQAKYDRIQSGVKNQKQVLEETLRILRKTLSECDIKGDKEEVKKVLSSIPQLEEIDEYQFEPINVDPPKKALEALVQSVNSDDK